MHKKWQEFHIFKHKFRIVLRLFYLDLTLIMMTFIIAAVDIRYSRYFTLLFLGLDLSFLIGSIIILRSNQDALRHLDELFTKDNYEYWSTRYISFQRLMDNNLFQYHFQPIIDAKNGEIFAYEALMRTDPNSINLQPVEILSLAAKEKRLYEIEKYTFYNTLRLMKENKEIFQTKKLFINSISDQLLTDVDFEEVYKNHSSLFSNLVIEISNASLLSDDNIRLIRKRIQESRCQLAIDRYNAACYCEPNHFKSNPCYIKIDRSLWYPMEENPKKQMMISNLMDYVHQNNIKIIAMGVENYDDFELALNFGVDYIQGFYTAKPGPILMTSLPPEIHAKFQKKNSIDVNDAPEARQYKTNGVSSLSLSELASEHYSEVVINEKEIRIQGNPERTAVLTILIPDNHSCNITLEQVRLYCDDKPAIILGKNCSVTLKFIGDNVIVGSGIRVPETADLKITGNGNLTVLAEKPHQIGIGGSPTQAYGNISFSTSGNIRVISKGEVSVAIGGGQNPNNSLLQILSGILQVESMGYNSVGIGSLSGNARVKMDGGSINILIQGTKTAAIGTLKGYVDILCNSDIMIKNIGRDAVCIGAIDDEDGSIQVQGGSIIIGFDSNCGCGIGSLSGKVNVDILNGNIEVRGDGANLVGVGSHNGLGDIHIKNGILSVQLYASHAIPVGNIKNHVIIDGGNIQFDFPEEIVPVNSYGTPLVARIIMDKDEFYQLVDTVSYSYEYQASYCSRYPYIKVYLPENIGY